MKARILIADDSQTIQKVVGIMLANEPYQLSQCSSEDELFDKFLKDDFDLILLDYNFSEKESGTQLVQKIIGHKPGAVLLVMLGTFDSIDENEIKSAGAKDTIVKPFESSVFLKKCNSLINRKDSEEDIDFSFKDEEYAQNQEWKVNAPPAGHEDSLEFEVENHLKEDSSSLKTEIESWGINIPEVIGDQKKISGVMEIPDVIGKKEESLLPNNENLEYPDPKGWRNNSTSKMMSLNDLTLDLDDDESIGETTEEIALSKLTNNSCEEEVNSDQSDEEFWSDRESAKAQISSVADTMFKIVDEEPTDQIIINQDDETQEEPLTISLADQVDSKMKKSSSKKDETSEINEEFFKDKIKEIITVHYEEDIINRLKEHVGPLLEKYVHKYCKEVVEKVTWEVIPDLAENLIKKELKKISESISEDHQN